MERVFQGSLNIRSSHTTGHTRVTFGGGKRHQCSQSLPSCQNTEGREGRLQTAMKQGLVLWEGTERLENWFDHHDHPHSQKNETGTNARQWHLSP